MRWFLIRNKSGNAPVEILLYGEIGGGWDGSGVEAKAFREELNAIAKGTKILLRIHSPGGSVFDGLAIYNAILERRADVEVVVDGLAASAASFIAMAASKIRMPKTARMMIHDAQGIAVGDSEELKRMAALLDRESDRIADIYAAKTGKSRNEIREMMKGTKWMDGNEAKSLGFADEVTDDPPAQNSFDLSAFRHQPAQPDNQQQTPAMNRNQLIALLKKHGVQFAENATDAELTALLETAMGDLANRIPGNAAAPGNPAPSAPAAPAPAASPTNAAPPAPAAGSPAAPSNAAPAGDAALLQRITALETQNAAERNSRITDRVTALAHERNLDPKPWITMALANEEAAMASLQAVPIPFMSPPVGGRVENNGNALFEGYRKLPAGEARLDFTVQNFDGLRGMNLRTGRFDPRNVNTFDSALTPNVLSDALITIMTTRLASLSFFSRRVELEPMKPKTPVVVTLFSTGSAAQVNPTTFQSNADSTLDPITVTPAHISKFMHLTHDQLQSGFELRKLALGSANLFADKISDQITGIMTAGNFGAGTAIGAAASFVPAGLAPILALAKNFPLRRLMLDFGHLAYLLPTDKFKFTLGEPGAYGFDGGIVTQNRWTGAIANTCGFVSSPDAIALAIGVPVEVPGGGNAGLQRSTVEVPQLGVSAIQHQWVDTSTRTLYASYDIMIGAAKGDATQGKVLITA